MALKAWQNIADSEIDRDSPIIENLMSKFQSNHEVLITQMVDFRFANESGGVPITSAGYVDVVTRHIFVPAQIGTTDGDVELVIAFYAKVSANNGDVRVRLNAGSWFTVNVTETSFAHKEIRLSAADTQAVVGAVLEVEMEARQNTGGTLTILGESGASRFERVV